ncbi:MAG: hypothetical protein L0Y79_05540 [Chlorobi bacterium]|nr:hypothetical protein [Chlorobiota bacterium]MCI0716487.1 hypothetical protein [Chlorobiota bacterium]
MTKEEKIKLSLNWAIQTLKDILRELIEKLENTTYPIITTICSGIDFMGGLMDGFHRENSKSRTINYITKYMGKVNPIYLNTDFAIYFYKYVRNYLIHQINGSVWHGINEAHEYHLKRILDDDSDMLFIHASLLKDEFIEALDYFCEDYKNDKDFEKRVLSNYEASITIDEEVRNKLLQFSVPIISLNELSLEELRKFKPL